MPTLFRYTPKSKMKTTSNTSAKKRRLPQRRRAARDELPQFRLTARDKQIVEAVYDYEALTPQQISDLFFAPVQTVQTPPPSSRCLHRLKLLYQYGFLEREERPQLLTLGRRAFDYRLTARGAELVALMRGITVEELGWSKSKPVSPLFLDHLITGNEVRVQIVRAAARHGYTIETWLDEKTLKRQQTDTVMLTSPSGRKQKAAVVPDGYFHLHTPTDHYHQFLEVDLRTVTGRSETWERRTWARKVQAYLAYYRSGRYQERYHTKSLRILTVTTGAKRLANLKEITEGEGGEARFWFTTLEQVRDADVLTDSIWQMAGREDVRSLVW